MTTKESILRKVHPAILRKARAEEAEHTASIAGQDKIVADHVRKFTNSPSLAEKAIKPLYSGMEKVEKNIVGRFLNK